MATLAHEINSEETGIRWTTAQGARERNEGEAKKFVRDAALHVLVHAIAYALIISLTLHFLMPSVLSSKSSAAFTLYLFFRSWPVVPIIALILWGFYHLLRLPIAYTVSESGLAWIGWTGRHFYDWRRLKAYRIEIDPKWPSVRLLKMKFGRAFGREWPFDPADVDEASLRRLFEEHGIPDAGAGPWFGSKSKAAG
ncbi:MAG TPA: hypothetical protein VFW40_01485 [Capsulimonadaceae bacterium]|nr:hypothetical protein [Capsulimonadaceae bacterium]